MEMMLSTKKFPRNYNLLHNKFKKGFLLSSFFLTLKELKSAYAMEIKFFNLLYTLYFILYTLYFILYTFTIV